MPLLLHEHWTNDAGDGEFCIVRERNDELRRNLMPNARVAFSLYASSWFEARQLEYDRLGFGDYVPADGVPDYIYTPEDAAEQEAYLLRRRVR